MGETIAEVARDWVRSNIETVETLPEHEAVDTLLRALRKQGFDVRDLANHGLSAGEIVRDELDRKRGQ